MFSAVVADVEYESLLDFLNVFNGNKPTYKVLCVFLQFFLNKILDKKCHTSTSCSQQSTCDMVAMSQLVW